MGCEDANDFVNVTELQSKTSSTNWIIVLVLEPTICLTGAQIFILYVLNIWSGQNLVSLGIVALNRNLVQLVLVAMDQRQM